MTKLLLVVLLLTSSTLFSLQAQQPTSTAGGGAKAAEPSFRVIRSVSGTKLFDEGGPSGVQDPRSLFYANTDKEIIVYFTWEGSPGPHHFEGLWKNPAGKIAMTSEFDYSPPQPRFGAYFKMLLGDTPAVGNWILEARIDGESAGSHSFQITAAPRPEGVTAPVRRRLIPSEVYTRAAAARVAIENIDLKGARRNIGTGFFIGPGRILTAFQVIDNASKLRVVGPDGKTFEVTEVLAVNRRQDWVVLKAPTENVTPLVRASDSWAIGDRAFLLDVPAENNRVLVETSLIGKQTLGAGGDRINIGDTVNRRAIGSPLLNEFAEVSDISHPASSIFISSSSGF